MASKDRSKEPPHSGEPARTRSKPASDDADWPKLFARLVEGVVTAELHEFEDNVMAFLDSAVADAYATVIWLCARFIGAAFLLTGLILFLGIFLPWWEAFGLVGVVVIAIGAFAKFRRRSRGRRARR